MSARSRRVGSSRTSLQFASGMVGQPGFATLTSKIVEGNMEAPFFLAVSFSCLSNNQTTAEYQRCRVSGATGANDYTPTRHEWNKNSQSNYKKTEYTIRHKSRYHS